MTPEEYQKWKKAGKIAAQALEYGGTLIKKGANIREVCDKIDQKAIDLGAKPAWPAQIGLNSVAAHWTSEPDDDAVFNDEVICLDVGAHIDGFVGDNALSIDLSGKNADVINAAKDALQAGIATVKAGVTLGEIGLAIQTAIEKYNLRPVRNLSGHGISQWVIHDSPSVPNFDTGDDRVLEEGMVIAIEPFATNGKGAIYESEQGNLFALVNKKPVRSPFAREILQFIEQEYKTLPFTTRWLSKKFGLGKTNLALRELMKSGILHSYPPLCEQQKNSVVAVFENTMIVRKDGAEILTK